mgnify:FL=1
MTKYVDREKAKEMFNRYFHNLQGSEAQTLVCDMKQAFLELPTADVVEVKDCEQCIHFGKHATEYPCSHCRNCYTDKFKPNDTHTLKEKDMEKSKK